MDFADIVAYPPEAHAGIIVFRLSKQDSASVLGRLRTLIGHLQSIPLAGHLAIVNDSRVRLREP